MTDVRTYRYIKELADRLNTLEGQMQAGEIPVSQYLPHHDAISHRRQSDEFSPPPNGEPPRKRAYSSISNEYGSPYQPQRSSTSWASQEPARHQPHFSSQFATPQSAPGSSQLFREPNYSPNGLQPLATWKTSAEPVRPQSISSENMKQGEHVHSQNMVEWDDAIIDR